MSKTVKAVIGACFGDEGKGMTVDFLSKGMKGKTAVVRYNGGAQAGHTVHSGGKHHIFNSIGSGTFNGDDTIWARDFVINPIIVLNEIEKLRFSGKIYAHPDCYISTPIDVLINQIVESHRAGAKHGSCGVGFGETIQRSQNEAYRLTVGQAFSFSRNYMDILFDAIRYAYATPRIHSVIGGGNFEWLAKDFDISRMKDDFISAVSVLKEKVTIASPREAVSQYPNIIFEGAQGLLLDADHEFFPHVTRSKTGSPNIAKFAEEAGIESVDVNYVMRSFMTRHGAGKFPSMFLSQDDYRGAIGCISELQDPTNVENPYQDKMRYGWLDLGLIGEAIKSDSDVLSASKIPYITQSTIVTWMNALNNDFRVIRPNGVRSLIGDGGRPAVNNLMDLIDNDIEIGVSYGSFGRDANSFLAM